MPETTESSRALEDSRAAAERLFHAYAAASSKASNPQARDLFGRLAAWEMHHFEEMERAQAALTENAPWVEYAPLDFGKADPGISDLKETWDRSGQQYFSEPEVLSQALDGERANYRMFLGLAAKAKAQKERDFWTALAADEDLHARVLKEQADALRTDGKWTWTEIREKGAPAPGLAAAKQAVAMISPISSTELPVTKSGKKRGPRETREAKGENETELLPPGWEAMSPERSQKFREVGWQPPAINDPKTPFPGSVAPPAAPTPGGGWVPMGKEVPVKDSSKKAGDGGWIPADKQHLMAPPPPDPEPQRKPPSTIRHVGREVRPVPGDGRPIVPTDTAIMDRPLAQTGGKWVYEASVKTAAQLCAPDPAPPDADAMALVAGPCRRALLDILNRRGAQGWELLQLAFHKDSVVFFWKRRE